MSYSYAASLINGCMPAWPGGQFRYSRCRKSSPMKIRPVTKRPDKQMFAGMGRRPISLPTFPQTVTHDDSPGNETD